MAGFAPRQAVLPWRLTIGKVSRMKAALFFVTDEAPAVLAAVVVVGAHDNLAVRGAHRVPLHLALVDGAKLLYGHISVVDMAAAVCRSTRNGAALDPSAWFSFFRWERVARRSLDVADDQSEGRPRQADFLASLPVPVPHRAVNFDGEDERLASVIEGHNAQELTDRVVGNRDWSEADFKIEWPPSVTRRRAL